MLSDEEKKAFESVKDMFSDVTIKDIDEQSITIYGVAMLDVIKVLTIVEKQSKEIEALKENNKKLTDEYLIQRDLINPDFLKDYISKEEAEQKEKKAYIDGTNVAHELCNKMWKNKIKAKIEELEKLNDEATGTGYGFAIYYLQSFLQKE